MKVGLSLLSKHKTFLGVQFGHGGYLKRNSEGTPVLVRTLELEIGFIFGWLILAFDSGRVINLDELNESLRNDVINGKTIE
jgi:hypothetical protein